MLRKILATLTVAAALLVPAANPAFATEPTLHARPAASGGGCAPVAIGVSPCISWSTGVGLVGDFYLDNQGTVKNGWKALIHIYVCDSRGCRFVSPKTVTINGLGHYGSVTFKPTGSGTAHTEVYFTTPSGAWADTRAGYTEDF